MAASLCKFPDCDRRLQSRARQLCAGHCWQEDHDRPLTPLGGRGQRRRCYDCTAIPAEGYARCMRHVLARRRLQAEARLRARRGVKWVRHDNESKVWARIEADMKGPPCARCSLHGKHDVCITGALQFIRNGEAASGERFYERG